MRQGNDNQQALRLDLGAVQYPQDQQMIQLRFV